MYEDITFERLQQRTLARVSDTLDKREGSIIYDAIAPVNVELQNMYIALDNVLNQVYADSASRDYLIRRAKERGISPSLATYAVVKGEFNREIELGSRFSLEVFNYTVIEKMDDNIYKLQCETLGSKPNAYIGDLMPVDYIPDLTMAKLTEILIPGEEDEDTETFRNRYYESFTSQAFGGNKADYQKKVNSIVGVGGTKVYRSANGGGTVGITIIASDYTVPSSVLVDKVQQAIDPLETRGDGEGLAPIYHHVTVRGVEGVEVDMEISIIYENNYGFEDIKSYVNEAVDKYFYELSSSWEGESQLVVRRSHVESRLLAIIGIKDITQILVNGSDNNLMLTADEIPVRGNIIG